MINMYQVQQRAAYNEVSGARLFHPCNGSALGAHAERSTWMVYMHMGYLLSAVMRMAVYMHMGYLLSAVMRIKLLYLRLSVRDLVSSESHLLSVIFLVGRMPCTCSFTS